MSLKYKHLVPIREDKSFQYYASNDAEYKHQIKVEVGSTLEFETMVKNDSLTIEDWNNRVREL